MSDQNQLAERPTTVKEYLALPDYKLRFQEVLGSRAPQFMSALVSVASQPHLANCEPRSVIASAMVAATLDLPIEKSLGFAHVVPYGNVAQFQMAAKGYVQLALRSAQYQRMNAKPINKEAFGGYDEVGEPKILWENLDETKPAAGYAVAWRLTNGFTKVAYWPREKVEAHAAKFSKAYKAKRADSPWFSNFDKMAIKTVVMNELRAWGVLSVQMQTALKHDMGVQKDVDSDVDYIDNETTDDVPMANVTPVRPPPPPKAAKGAAAVKENVAPVTAPEPVVASVAAPAPVPARSSGTEVIAEVVDVPAAPAPAAVPEPAPKAAPAPKPVAPTASAAPATPASRTSINHGEIITAVVTVAEFKRVVGKRAGADFPYVSARVHGEFAGDVVHTDGGLDALGQPISAWQLDTPVKITLKGELKQKLNKVIALVQSIELASPAPVAPAADVSDEF